MCFEQHCHLLCTIVSETHNEDKLVYFYWHVKKTAENVCSLSHLYLYSAFYNTDCVKAALTGKQFVNII